VPGRPAGLIAYHFEQGGQPTQAARYHQLAGDHARRLYAHRQALDHYQKALALGSADLCALNEATGDLHTLLGEYAPALEAYRRAAACAPAAEAPRLAHKMGGVHQRRGDWPAAIARYRNALEADPPPAEALAARILADWSLAAFQSGEPDTSQSLAQQALERACQADEPVALAQTHNLLGILARKRGDLETARHNLEDSLQIGRQLDDLGAQAAALNNLALVFGAMGATDAAIDYTQQALELCERLGDRHRAAALHNNLADLYHHSGQPEAAMQHLKQAVVIFAEIGGHAADMQPEVWKLTEW
jgi:tetratricopeptide (TPR) repeat protein